MTRICNKFFDLKLGNMTMEEYEKKFLELLRYMDFILDEKVKKHRFMTNFPSFYKEKNQSDECTNLEDAMRKDKYLYEWNK
jgi:hypothetical protein